MIKFVADIGSCHNQNLNRAYQLIDMAKDSGCWGVKFQHFEVEKLYHLSVDIDFEQLKKMELPREWIPVLCEYAKKIGLAFGMTFFHTGVMNQFQDCHFDFVKISSFDTGRDNLIREALICTNKRLIISTGLMDIPGIIVLNEKIATWESQLAVPHKELTFMHCVSEYPAKNAYLGFMLKMTKEGWNVGYSDHTVDRVNIMRAAILGAKYIELHIDLDDKLGYENIGHCWGQNELKTVIEIANTIKMNDKIITDEMLKNKADPEDGMRPVKRFRGKK
jgi:sialic acid synthase SpsE